MNHALCRQLEWIEARAFADMFDAVPPHRAPALGLEAVTLRGAVALRCAGIDSPLFNRVMGLGVEEPADRATLDALIGAYSRLRPPVPGGGSAARRPPRGSRPHTLPPAEALEGARRFPPGTRGRSSTRMPAPPIATGCAPSATTSPRRRRSATWAAPTALAPRSRRSPPSLARLRARRTETARQRRHGAGSRQRPATPARRHPPDRGA